MASSDLDAAVVGYLHADSVLATLLPDGVYLGAGPPGVSRFALVTLEETSDLEVFGGRRVLEDVLYHIAAVALSTAMTDTDIEAAAARIDDLLANHTLPAPGGYAHVLIYRAGPDDPRTVTKTPDSVDPSLRWIERGGHYRLQASPIP